MMSILLEFNSFDGLFFRDAKPFSKGTDFRARSIFPPLPSVVRGALRTKYFSENMQNFSKAGVDGDPSETIRINCVMLKYQSELYVPVPQNFEIVVEDGVCKAFLLDIKPAPECSTYPLPYVLTVPDCFEGSEPAKGEDFIRIKDIAGILQGSQKTVPCIRLSDIMFRELKTGIAADYRTGTNIKSMLYQSEMLYPFDEQNNPVSLVALADRVNEVVPDGLLKLGGEGKAAYYHEIDTAILRDLAYEIDVQKHFSVTLLSPAIFKNGWCPGWLSNTEEGQWIGKYNGVKVRLVAAACSRPVPISGFDMKRKLPKPMYYAAAAGSVYYFELLDGSPEAVLSAFHMRNISELQQEEGLGYALVGQVSALT